MISSIQLKVLDLCNCYDLEEIMIDAPNLFECAYQGDGSIRPHISIRNSSSQLVFNVVFLVKFFLDLENLRSFLEYLECQHIPVSLFLGFRDNSTVEFDQVELQDYLMGPPSIVLLTLLAISDAEELSFLLVTGIFWSCRPSIVSFNWDANKTLVKAFAGVSSYLCRLSKTTDLL